MTASIAPATSRATTAPPVVLPRLGVADFVIAGITGVAAFLIYFNTLAPGLLVGDSGEFQFAAWLGGFAHPTGYPLYLLLGYLWAHLIRAGEPAWRMNLFSAVWGGAAIGLVYLLTLQTIRVAANPPGLAVWIQRIAALFAAMLLAVSPTFWSQAVITEVYTMHAALVAAIFLGLISWKARGASSEAYRILYVTAFLYGLGLAHHRSTLLLAPAIIVFLWQSRSWSGSWRQRLGGLALGLLLVALPLLLYALIPLRGPQMPYADVIIAPNQIIQLYRPTVGWFVQHITGSGFGSAFHTPTQPLDRIIQSLTWLVEEMSWPGILLGVIGAVWLFFRSRALLTLTGLALLTLFGFNLLYSIGDIRVFYIPVYLIWALWAGLGVSAFAWLLLSRGADEPLRHGLAALLCGSLLALPVLLYSQRLPQLDQSRNDHAAQFWRDTLAKPIPQGAILISNDRDEMTPLLVLAVRQKPAPRPHRAFPPD